MKTRSSIKSAAEDPLANRIKPTQKRAAETYEIILHVASELLAEVGIERLSTNLICERAGLSPPALYRYFPNKYAILSELGQRLMQRQNELVPQWIRPEVLAGSMEEIQAALYGLTLATYRVTQDTPGGVWILRAMRAVPALTAIRLQSHEVVTTAQGQLLIDAFPDADRDHVVLIGRIAVDIIYAVVELLFDVALDEQAVATIIASMIASKVADLRKTQSVEAPEMDA